MTLSRMLLLVSLLCAFVCGVNVSWAGEAGTLSCTTPGCGYNKNFTIGGGMQSPSVTGYCTHGHGFVRVKLKHWNDYYKKHYCPVCHQAIKPIYDSSQATQFPCPNCGNLTLKYERRLMFD
jgi:predicted RNA-binding Zn-ribbon protein involved in translation (DUF1610 family)